MIGNDKKICRVGKSDILSIPGRICVAVGAQDGQVRHLAVKSTGDVADGRVRWKQTVVVKGDGVGHVIFTFPCCRFASTRS